MTSFQLNETAAAEIHETHTGIVILIGDRAYKVKKPVATDFLDFSTHESREIACAREVSLNRRIAPNSYLGVARLTDPEGGESEPVIVMRRYPDSMRLSTLATTDRRARPCVAAIAAVLSRFHVSAQRGPAIDAAGSREGVTARFAENTRELGHYGSSLLPVESISEIGHLATQYANGRGDLFDQRIEDRRIVDGHGDLLADDIFCTPDGPVILDCLEFDDSLRFVDCVDDAAFLAMDLEFLGRGDLARYFVEQYIALSSDAAPRSLWHFYIAYRAAVRAKVDCIRVLQGQPAVTASALRHLDMAHEHMDAATVRLILVGGGPGTGKTTISNALAQRLHARVVSTDEVRRQLKDEGVISGNAGTLDSGLYSARNVATVYDEVLSRARGFLTTGHSVVLDGSWRDEGQRSRARCLADETCSQMSEFECSAPLATAQYRITHRGVSLSDATALIAEAFVDGTDRWPDAHRIDTSMPVSQSVERALQIIHPRSAAA